jgi:hypothetical protein
MAGPSKKARLSTNLTLREEDIVEEIYADTDSEQEENDSVLQDSEDDDTLDDDLEDDDWRGKLLTDRAPLHAFQGEQNGLNRLAAPSITDESKPGDYFMLFFRQILPLLLLETNRYMEQVFTAKGKTRPPTQEIFMKDLLAFLALVIQMGHDHKPSIKSYWTKDELYHVPFYSNVMSRDLFLTILKYLHFTNNENPPAQNRADPNYDRLWKLRQIFDTLNSKFSELYHPTEQMAVDEVIVKFKGKVIFRQYIPTKHKRFGIKLYKLCDKLGYTFDMSVYLGKQKKNADKGITPTHGTVLELVRKVEGVGHKIFMDNYFTSPNLFNDLHSRKINACGTVRHNRKGMPSNFSPKDLKMKKGDIVSRVKGTLRAVCWKDKRDVYVLSNMHLPPVEGNFKAEGRAIKPAIIEEYNTHMGYVDLSDRMANSYNICRRTWKWTKKLFFHLMDLTILNAYILNKSCGSTTTHLKFREQLVRDLIVLSREGNTGARVTPRGRPSLLDNQILRLEVKHSSHWPEKGRQRRCRLCQLNNKKTSKSLYFCPKCDCGLCIVPCFAAWHTKTKIV